MFKLRIALTTFGRRRTGTTCPGTAACLGTAFAAIVAATVARPPLAGVDRRWKYGPRIIEISCIVYLSMDCRCRGGLGGPELVPEAPSRGGGRHSTRAGTGSRRPWRDEGGRQPQPTLQKGERKGEVGFPACEDTVVPELR